MVEAITQESIYEPVASDLENVIAEIATIAEGRCAIAISRGGARKTYRHKHLNEDVAAFITGDGGSLVAVADGHSGCEASETAVTTLAERHAPRWTAQPPMRSPVEEVWSYSPARPVWARLVSPNLSCKTVSWPHSDRARGSQAPVPTDYCAPS